MKISKDKVVQIHYTLTNNKNEQIDTSRDKNPFEYLHGRGMMIPGLEAALEGKEVGDKFVTTVLAKDAYGEHDDRCVIEVERSHFESCDDIQVGMAFEATSPNGKVMLVHVVKVTDDVVTIDSNHELAGQDLTFDVEVIDIRDVTEEELKQFENGGCGCGCDCGSDCGSDCGDSGCCCDGGCN